MFLSMRIGTPSGEWSLGTRACSVRPRRKAKLPWWRSNRHWPILCWIARETRRIRLGTLLYLGCLPLSWLSYRRLQQQTTAAPGPMHSVTVTPPTLSSDGPSVDDNRPTRLN